MTNEKGETCDGISFVTEHERCPDCGRDVHVSETPMHFGCLAALREENARLRESISAGLMKGKGIDVTRQIMGTFERLEAALAPLVAIADAYDENELDDEARKRWGKDLEYENERAPETIELYTGRGGARLLTLADCFRAREAVRGKRT